MDEARIDVVPIAVSGAFHPISRELAVSKVKARFGMKAPFLLTVGDLQPRKNQIGLIRAFESIAPLLPARYTLDIVGSGAEEDVLRRQAPGDLFQVTN